MGAVVLAEGAGGAVGQCRCRSLGVYASRSALVPCSRSRSCEPRAGATSHEQEPRARAGATSHEHEHEHVPRAGGRLHVHPTTSDRGRPALPRNVDKRSLGHHAVSPAGNDESVATERRGALPTGGRLAGAIRQGGMEQGQRATKAAAACRGGGDRRCHVRGEPGCLGVAALRVCSDVGRAVRRARELLGRQPRTYLAATSNPRTSIAAHPAVAERIRSPPTSPRSGATRSVARPW